LQWITSLQEITNGQIIAIDGKTLRCSCDKRSGKLAVHMVSAWATENHVSLGQTVVDAKSNEMTAIPILLKIIEVSGALVTIDAMGCQTAIAAKIIDEKAHYCLEFLVAARPRWVICGSLFTLSSSHALENRRDPLADADAHRGQAERGIAVDHRVNECRRDAGTAGA